MGVVWMGIPSLKTTYPLKFGWLEYDRFLLGRLIFRGELLVLGIIIVPLLGGPWNFL